MFIINSLLDTDFYKLNMLQHFFLNNSDIIGRYEFKCRNKGIVWTDKMVSEIKKELNHLENLSFTTDELTYLKNTKLYKESFIEFLRVFKFNTKHIALNLVDGELKISAKGPIIFVSPLEIPILAIVNEIYFRNMFPDFDYYRATIKLNNKVELALESKIKFSDFGTRRRFSHEWQDFVVRTFAKKLPNDIFTGTSNPYFAMKYNILPIGTMAHEYVQLFQALPNVSLIDSQKTAFQEWAELYRGNLGIALSDTLGIKKFLKDFDGYFVRLYDGVRHDSGDPFVWGSAMITHYEKFGIDPKTKRLVFSDGLDFELAIRLNNTFKDKIMVGFGIGTNLTNDMGKDIIPLQIVMKLVEVNGKPVAKISDTPAKGMCEDETFLSYLKKIIED
jgi:nicotinate phosphoribosyltransferase